MLLDPAFPANASGAAAGPMFCGVFLSLSAGYGLAFAKDKWDEHGQKILS